MAMVDGSGACDTNAAQPAVPIDEFMIPSALLSAADGEEWETLDDLARKKAREKEERLEENKNKSTSQLLQEVIFA